MKTVEEAADYLSQQLRWFNPDNRVLDSDRADIISALNTFARERVDEALEAAAKIAEKSYWDKGVGSLPPETAKAIRALKSNGTSPLRRPT